MKIARDIPDFSTLSEAEINELLDAHNEKCDANGWTLKPHPKGRPDMPQWAFDLLHGARRRSAKMGLPFRLDEHSMARIVHRAGGRCELTAIEFDLSRHPTSWRRPLAPSLDRINSAKGYSPANCRLVVYAVNAAMNEWGEEMLIKIAEAIVAKRRAAGTGDIQDHNLRSIQ